MFPPPKDISTISLDFSAPYIGEMGAVLLCLLDAQTKWTNRTLSTEENLWKDTPPVKPGD